MTIGSNSAEEDAEVAIANLKMFLDLLTDGGRPCDYLLDFATLAIADAKKKMAEGRVLKSEFPSESHKYY